MNNPDEILKLQTQFSEWSGARKTAEWLLVLGLLIMAGSVVSALVGKENFFHAAGGSLGLIAVCVQMRSQAKRRALELAKQLS